MTRNVIATGTVANDGSGDSLRDASTKINNNFQQIWEKIGGSSSNFTEAVGFDSTGINLLGSQLTFKTKLEPTNPTADRVITVPDTSGELVLTTSNKVSTNILTAEVSVVDITSPVTIFNRATSVAASVSDATTTRSIKMINVGLGTVTVTPASFANGTSFQIENQESCEIIWGGTNWHLINSAQISIL